MPHNDHNAKAIDGLWLTDPVLDDLGISAEQKQAAHYVVGMVKAETIYGLHLREERNRLKNIQGALGPQNSSPGYRGDEEEKRMTEECVAQMSQSIRSHFSDLNIPPPTTEAVIGRIAKYFGKEKVAGR